MSRHVATGIDIGTCQIKVIVAESASQNERQFPRIAGTGIAESRGLRHGYIVNKSEVAKSIHEAVHAAEKASGQKIKKAFISVGGISLAGTLSSGAVMISRGDQEISELDIEKVMEISRTDMPAAAAQNRKIIHSIPLQYKIDGKPVLGRPVGMKGNKLEVRTLFITCLEHHVHDLIEAVEDAGVIVEDVIAAPIAASLVALTKTQKIAGCVLANIGSETVSIAVFENNIPISLEVFPIGSNDITNDIALGLRIPIEEAEDLKLGKIIGVSYPRKKLEEIIVARLSDIFELIEAHLKKIGKNGLLPAGIVITGGGSGIETIEDLAKAALKLPSRIATMYSPEGSRKEIKDAAWSVAYGLCILGLNTDDEGDTGYDFIRRAKGNVLGWIKQFLP